MFLIRTAFWLTLVIFLLPANEQEQRAAVQTTGAVVSDVKTFCVRNPELCEKGAFAFETFSQKAKYGWRMLNDLLRDQVASGDGQTGVQPASLQQGTLTPSDLLPAWASRASGSKV